jgi:phage replication O-like protein O
MRDYQKRASKENGVSPPPKPVRPFSQEKEERGGFIPFPQILIDEIMPIAGSNSWRVLCFIIRKTLGWNKEFDVIDYEQISVGTGISSPNAISDALSELQGKQIVKKGSRKKEEVPKVALPQLIIKHPGKRKANGRVRWTKQQVLRTVTVKWITTSTILLLMIPSFTKGRFK